MSELRAAFRSLVRWRTSSLVVLATLSLGIAALAAGWSAVRSTLLAPLPFADPDRLVRVRLHPVVGENLEWEASMPTLRALQAEARTLDGIEGWGTTSGRLVVRLDSGLDRVEGQLVTAGWFDLLGVPPLVGRSFSAEDDQPGAGLVVLLSEGLWRSRFGADPGVLGRSLEVGGEDRRIVGVMPRHADLPVGADLWLPLGTAVPPAFLEAAGIAFVNPVARLAGDASPAAAREEMDAILRREIHPQVSPAQISRTSVVPLAEELRGPLRIPALALLAGALLVLLTGAANVGGLLAVRALRRRGELAVRMGLGAGWWQVARLAFLEVGLLAGAGALGGALLAPQLLSALVGRFPRSLFLADSIRVDVPAVLLAAAVCLVLASAFGAGLASWSRRIDAAEALRTGAARVVGDARSPMLRALAAAQVAGAVAIVLAAGLLVRSVEVLDSADAGFARESVLSFEVPLPGELEADPIRKTALHEELLEELATLPGVEAAGGALMRPLHAPVGLDTQVTVEGRGGDAPENVPLINLVPVSVGWFDAAGMRLLEGRGFAASDEVEAPGVVVLSRSVAARIWPEGSAVGSRIKWGGPQSPHPWLQVVGVVDDVRWRSIEAATPSAFIPFVQSSGWGIEHFAVRTTADPWTLLGPVREVVGRLVPGSEPLDVVTMEQMVDRALAARMFVAAVVGSLAATSLVLVALGLYGLLAFLVTVRRRETGVRMALGASPAVILRELVGQCGRVAAVGVGLGLAGGSVGAFLVGSWLEPALAGVPALDPWTFAAAPLLVLGVALLAGLPPARRAAGSDPAAILQDE